MSASGTLRPVAGRCPGWQFLGFRPGRPPHRFHSITTVLGKAWSRIRDALGFRSVGVNAWASNCSSLGENGELVPLLGNRFVADVDLHGIPDGRVRAWHVEAVATGTRDARDQRWVDRR